MTNTLNNPLVSVSVICYRSAGTITETLDSIAAQTYQNIELIVSDDCSPDNTVEIVRDWIDAHRERFVRCELITVNENTGVSANYNRAMDACCGEWVKDIDGDDLLLPNCIADFVDYIMENKNARYVFGKMQGFGRGNDEVKEYMDRCFDYTIFNLAPNEQMRRLVYNGNCISSPTNFYNLKYVRGIGVRNDERIPFLEDYPKWINLLRAGVTFYFMDKTIVEYRLSDNSLSTTTKPNPSAVQSNALLTVYYLCPLMWQFGKKSLAIHKYINAAPDAFGGLFWRSLYRLDRCFTNIFIKLGVIKSGEARKEL